MFSHVNMGLNLVFHPKMRHPSLEKTDDMLEKHIFLHNRNSILFYDNIANTGIISSDLLFAFLNGFARKTHR